jgi:hypothetical protein
LGLQAFLAILLIFKRSWKSFPIFAIFSLSNFLGGLTGFLVQKSPVLYLYAFLISESLAILLGLGVVYEIFVHLFSAQAALRRIATYSLGVAVAILVAIACATLWVNSPGGLRGLGAAILLTEETTRLLEVGLLMFLFVCSSTFGLHWRQPVFGITLGLAISVAVELITVTVWRQIGAGSSPMFSVVRLVVSNLTLLVWAGYFVAPERVRSADLPERAQLEQWNRAVMELIHQ